MCACGGYTGQCVGVQRELPNLPNGGQWRSECYGEYTLQTPVSVIDGEEYTLTGVSCYLVTPDGFAVQISSIMARNIPSVISLIIEHGTDPRVINKEFLLQKDC